MNASNSPQSSLKKASIRLVKENHRPVQKIKPISNQSAPTLPNRIVTHNPNSGLNPVVDAAGYLFSSLGKLSQIQTIPQLGKLQQDLLQQMNSFEVTLRKLNYNPKLITVCRYILCAALDDIIAHSSWSDNHWDNYRLLAVYSQSPQTQEQFFTVLERAINKPAIYIDLMELIYICLSMGYQGSYRTAEQDQYQLNQITNNLYQHIRAHRGKVGKLLSPIPPKSLNAAANAAKRNNVSLFSVLFVTACIITIIFVSLGYLMDVISNEAYKPISQIQTPIFEHATG